MKIEENVMIMNNSKIKLKYININCNKLANNDNIHSIIKPEVQIAISFQMQVVLVFY